MPWYLNRLQACAEANADQRCLAARVRAAVRLPEWEIDDFPSAVTEALALNLSRCVQGFLRKGVESLTQ